MAAGVEAGYPHSKDYNGYRQKGMVRFDLNTMGVERASTAQTYIRPAQQRPNLAVETSALATRIMVAGGRASGVEYR